ncbi:MAG: hypothetical protein V4641_09690, partial [Pseudomonadota bacterium]
LALALVLVALVPFLLVYLPKARETGMHGYAAARLFALSPFDLLDVGSDNYRYGGLVPWLSRHVGFPSVFSENQMGMPPLLLALFVAATVWTWRHRHEPEVQPVLAAALAALLVALLVLKIHQGSAWRVVFYLVPGARGVRVISRWMIF